MSSIGIYQVNVVGTYLVHTYIILLKLPRADTEALAQRAVGLLLQHTTQGGRLFLAWYVYLIQL